MADAARLIVDLDGGAGRARAGGRPPTLAAGPRRSGLHTSARKLAGEDIAYADEVELCYGVRPQRWPEDEFEAAHRRLDQVLPGAGPLGERFVAWREAQAIDPAKLPAVIDSLADDLRERTDRLFGLPDGEHIDWELVTDQPWSGFNYYLGDLRSRVAINLDLPVLSTSIAHLVAHEAYPGHHTEHTRKEVGLVRDHGHLEETIFPVGTPAVPAGRRAWPTWGSRWSWAASRGSRWPSTCGRWASATTPRWRRRWRWRGRRSTTSGATSASCSTPTARMSPTVIDYAMRWGLVSRDRAAKMVQFMTDPTWRAYISCYLEGLPLCRAFVDGDPTRFQRLLDDQLPPRRSDCRA